MPDFNFQIPDGYDDIETLEKRLHFLSEYDWILKGQKRALKLFYEMSNRVPAYKDFLKIHKVNPNKIKTIYDFALIPPLNKDNYLRKYPREMLSWDGQFPRGQWVISSTSGSTGQPFYFPRTNIQDRQYAITAELYLRSNFEIDKKSTLYIDAFPMGAWIGGLFTYEAIKIIASQGPYSISIITPGIHKLEVIKSVKQLGNNFDQIIIGAYPPFLKDILDDGIREGLDWEQYNLGFIFSAEAFTEDFRDYVLRKIGSKDQFTTTLNHYGTVDIGTMAHETPESIMIRRLLVDGNNLKAIFPESIKQPTFAQYNPEMFYFDSENHNLFCTSYSGLPLVRYDLGDYGDILTHAEVRKALDKVGVPLDDKINYSGIKDKVINLPFIYVYERNDFSVSYYAFIIYPDMIRRPMQSLEAQKFLTGKFSMQVDYSKEGRQQLNINVELRHGVGASKEIQDKLVDILHNSLIKESSEYREVTKMIGMDIQPMVHLWPYEEPKFFSPGTKQRWVIS